jgi:hypothetical protein
LERGNHLIGIGPLGADANLVALASSDIEQADSGYGDLFRTGGLGSE